MEKRLQPIEIPIELKARLDAWRNVENAGDVLLDEIKRCSNDLERHRFSLQQTVSFWTLTSVFNEIAGDQDRTFQFFPLESDAVDPVFDWLAKASYLANSAVVFRTYVSVVMGRTDELISTLVEIHTRVRGNALGKAIKLLREDEVRILRNAIGHGTFDSWGQVLDYRDGKKCRRISFRELDQLNSQVFRILAVLLATLPETQRT